MLPPKPDISVCSCLSSRDNLSDFPELKERLPSDYEYRVCNWNRVDDDCFESRFRVNVTSKTEAHLWLNRFSAATNTIFREEEELPKCEEAVIFSMRCKHTTKEPPRIYKDIGFLVSKQSICPTRLVVILKLPAFAEKYGLDDDVHLHDFPMTVIHHQHHNHPLDELPVDIKKDLSAANAYIVNTLNALEIQLQKSATESSEAGTSYAENTEEKPNHHEFQSYQEVLYSLFPAKSAEEENESDFLLPLEKHPFNFDVDADSLIDYYRATRKTDRSDAENTAEGPNEFDDGSRAENTAEESNEFDDRSYAEIIAERLNEFDDRLYAESIAEEPNEFEFYQAMLWNIFLDNSAEEPRERRRLNFDVDYSLDRSRATCMTNQTEFVWVWPQRRNFKAADMKMLPNNPMQEIINQALEKLWNLEEDEEESEIV